jgi:uncharacterized protein YndB with AHSA1/START domain
MVLKVVVVVAVVIAAVLVYAATRPNQFEIERAVSINASPEKVFALINDFHNWGEWAPQDREDPTMQRIYGGAVSGAGAVSDWDSRGSAGRGRMTISESTPPTRVVVQVDWAKPFVARNVNEFTLEPGGASTKVTWRMQGPNLYAMKLMSVFMNMDKMMGRHFETGLQNLKTIAEK